MIETLLWSEHPHRKLLLHMSLSQRRYADLSRHLREVWFRGGSRPLEVSTPGASGT